MNNYSWRVNIPVLEIDRKKSKKWDKITLEQHCRLKWLNWLYIYKAFHSKTAEYRYFSSMHGTVMKIGHILSHKTSLNIFK